MTCKVSVIIPVYNSEKYLRACLDSVVNQTLRDIEIICVNDGSTDNSLAILQEYAQKDGRITILNQPNLYAGVARNNGLAKATGEYVHFLDADDWVDSFTYEELYQLAQEKKASVVKFRCYSYDNESRSVRCTFYTDISGLASSCFDMYLNWEKHAPLIVSLPDSAWSGFYARKFLLDNNIQFDAWVCANDTGFFYRCLVAAGQVYLAANRYVYYREKVRGSLVTQRALHFECQTAVYGRVCADTSQLPLPAQAHVKDRLLWSCFGWYLKCLRQVAGQPKVTRKLHVLMKRYFQNTADVQLLNRDTKRRYKRAKQTLQKFIWKKKLLLSIRLSLRKMRRYLP